MSDPCCSATSSGPPTDARFRRALWIALVVNAAMFGIEIAGSVAADSVSLLADAVDFLGDAANYALSLLVLALVPIWRSRAALVKGWTMAAYGLFVLIKTGWNAVASVTPEPITMGTIAILALIANTCVAGLLYSYRSGDANMRSVWLCSRNDAIVNMAVVLAALGVFGTGAAWPDLVIAVGIAALALTTARSVIKQSSAEIRAQYAIPARSNKG